MNMATDDTGSRPRPLQGVRVLDFTSMMAGPYATRYLADLGAEVLKVEPAEGDYIRQRLPLREGYSAYFSHLNAGKRSIVLDLKHPAGIQAAKELAAHCDVLVEAFRPGVMKRLGLDPKALMAAHPRLIVCSVSGFGQSGPASQRPAYAQIVQAESGYELAFANYQDNAERPANTAIFYADVLGGTFAFSGILAALNQRHITGRGQWVDSTLMESMLNLMPYEVQEAQFPAAKRRPVYPPFRTLDGYLMIAAVNPRNFEALLDAIGVSGWREDSRMKTDAARQANWGDVMAVVEAWTCQRQAAECERLLAQSGVPVTVYRTVREALSDPQFAHRGSLATVEDGGGVHRVPNLPYRMSESRVEVGHRTPNLGEHTTQVLSELLGYTDDQIRRAQHGDVQTPADGHSTR